MNRNSCCGFHISVHRVRNSFKNKTAVNSIGLNNMNVTAFFVIDHSVKNKLIAVEVFYILYRLNKLNLKSCLRINYINIYKTPKIFLTSKEGIITLYCKL